MGVRGIVVILADRGHRDMFSDQIVYPVQFGEIRDKGRGGAGRRKNE